MKHKAHAVLKVSDQIATVIPSEARNLALVLLAICSGPDSSLRSE
jgi:hypothetical protein